MLVMSSKDFVSPDSSFKDAFLDPAISAEGFSIPLMTFPLIVVTL